MKISQCITHFFNYHLEKDIVDEIVFRTRNPRNRLMLELMARSGMRVGEVLKLKQKGYRGTKSYHPRSQKRKRGGGCLSASEGRRSTPKIYQWASASI